MLALLALATVAHADPTRPLARVGEPLEERTWATIEGEGPAIARWRRRDGPIRAWTFPDGQVERYVRSERGAPVSATFYSDAGQPLGALTWAEGRPARYDPIVPDLDPVDVSAWVPVAAHGLALAAPGEGTAWSVGGGALSVDRYAPGDVTADAYRDALAAGCACRVVDRHSAWLDGRAGVRFLVELPGPDGGRRGEAWAFPVDDAVVALAATWPVDDPGAHAALRAMVALATWEASP